MNKAEGVSVKIATFIFGLEGDLVAVLKTTVSEFDSALCLGDVTNDVLKRSTPAVYISDSIIPLLVIEINLDVAQPLIRL